MNRSHRVSIASLHAPTYAPLPNASPGFSLMPLLLHGQSLSEKAQRALRENRIRDAAVILMEDYGLSCVEAEDLLNVTAC